MINVGADGNAITTTSSNHDYTYSMLDAFVPLPGDDSTYCRCKRGAQVRMEGACNSMKNL